MSAGEIDLQPGERVLWAGEPVQRPFFNKGDLVMVPLSLIVAIAAVALLLRQPAGLVKIGLLVVLVLALYALVGRLVVRYLTLGKTTYALTDSRVIARAGLFRMKELSDPLAQLGSPVIAPGKPGTGTITFGPNGQRVAVTLVGIGQPKRVRDTLTKAIEEARRREGISEPETPAR
jgi:hypothetical protein